jgi:hypothetical protein
MPEPACHRKSQKEQSRIIRSTPIIPNHIHRDRPTKNMKDFRSAFVALRFFSATAYIRIIALPIPKPAKSPQLLESRVRPGCENLAISAGADAVYAHAAKWPGFATPRWPGFTPQLTFVDRPLKEAT